MTPTRRTGTRSTTAVRWARSPFRSVLSPAGTTSSSPASFATTGHCSLPDGRAAHGRPLDAYILRPSSPPHSTKRSPSGWLTRAANNHPTAPRYAFTPWAKRGAHFPSCSPGLSLAALHLQPRAGLSSNAPAESDPDGYRYDPADPTPRGGVRLAFGVKVRPRGQHKIGGPVRRLDLHQLHPRGRMSR